MSDMRFVLLGREAPFTLSVLECLDGRFAPEALVLAGYGPPAPPADAGFPLLPLERPDRGVGVAALAENNGLPVHWFGTDAQGAAWPGAGGVPFAPDLIVLACFPYILSPGWLRIPRLGVLNVHPSLLPDFRGGDPVSAQRALGWSATGVTVHWATEDVDAGPILARCALPVDWTRADGVIHRTLGWAGGRLLRASLPTLGAIGGRSGRSGPACRGAAAWPWARSQDGARRLSRRLGSRDPSGTHAGCWSRTE